MDSGTIIAIVIVAVVAIVAAGLFMMRRPEAPKGEAEREPSPEKKPERRPDAAKRESREAAPKVAVEKAAPKKDAAPKPAELKPSDVAVAPEAKAPEARAPEARAPEAKAPEAKAPEAGAETKAAEPAAEPPAAAKPAEPKPAEPAAPVAARVAVAPVEEQPAADDKKLDGREQVSALKKGLASTRGGFIARLARIFGGKKEIDPALLDQVQEVLITADIGVRTTEKILARLRERQRQSALATEDAVWEAIREDARDILGASVGGVRLATKPATILVVGVNGVGKTTTIGKLASRFKDDGKKVILAAGDTYRPAAVLQLDVWAKKVGVDIFKGKDRADPASVVYEAIKKAQAESMDVVIADTAGRLHTKANLMEELKKVVRSAEKALERSVDEILLVLDSTTGQNAIQQVELFKGAIPVNGIVLTKLDGTAKGGVVLGIIDEHHIPLRYIGIGERIEDLREFDTEAFVAALFAKPDDEPAAA